MDNHIWTVKSCDGYHFTVNNIRTGKEYKLTAKEFIRYTMDYEEIVDIFPNYIHDEVWELHGNKVWR